MKNLILLLLVIVIISCNRIDKIYEKERDVLESQIDSLKQLNEKLTSTNSFLFEKALGLEKSDEETAFSIYKTIADSKNGDFWSIEAEKRIINLTKEEDVNKNTKYLLFEDFYWLFDDTLELSQVNEKCGEWGGDVETIRIFLKSGKLSGYYMKETYDCDSLAKVGYMRDKVTPTIYRSKETEFTTRQIELLKETILSLEEYQLNNLEFYGNSGIVNTVRVNGKDSYKKIFIHDYPSFHWNKFHRLKNEISQ